MDHCARYTGAKKKAAAVQGNGGGFIDYEF